MFTKIAFALANSRRITSLYFMIEHTLSTLKTQLIKSSHPVPLIAAVSLKAQTMTISRVVFPGYPTNTTQVPQLHATNQAAVEAILLTYSNLVKITIIYYKKAIMI